MRRVADVLWICMILATVSSALNAQVIDSNYIRVRDLGQKVYYVGIGPSANYSEGTIAGLLPNELEDPTPLVLGFGDADLTDSADIEVRCRRNVVNNNMRLVMRNVTANKVIANICLRPTAVPGEYELDVPPGSGVAPVRPVDSIKEETLKWLAVGTYFTTIQTVAAVDPDCPCAGSNTPCTVHFPHDDICTGFGSGGSGPFNINKVRVFAACYGTTWVDLLSCCQSHDRSLWCTGRSTRFFGVQWINIELMACIIGKVTTAVAGRVPWYCGGAIVGAILGAAQGAFIGQAAFLVVTVITNGQLIAGDNCYISAGDELKSCLCGGDVQTLRCRDGLEMCKGKNGLQDLQGPTGEVCICDPDDHTGTLEVTPVIPGATYTWHAEGNATVTQDPLNPHRATVNATGNGTVSVVVEIPGCGLNKKFTRTVTNGVPPKPVITTFGGATPTCIPRRPGTSFVVDKNLAGAPSACPTEYKLQFTSNVGGTVVHHTAALQKWSKDGNWFLARPDLEGTQFCVTVTARNKCGESEPTTFCVNVDDDCPPVNGTIAGPDASGVPTTGLDADQDVLYPNPATGSVTLRMAEAELGATISVVDMGGNVMVTAPVQSKEVAIDLAGVPAGPYIVNITKGRVTVARQLVVVR